MGKRKISTFSKSIPEEQAEAEKAKNTSLGKSLKKADELYSGRRKK